MTAHEHDRPSSKPVASDVSSRPVTVRTVSRLPSSSRLVASVAWQTDGPLSGHRRTSTSSSHMTSAGAAMSRLTRRCFTVSRSVQVDSGRFTMP